MQILARIQCQIYKWKMKLHFLAGGRWQAGARGWLARRETAVPCREAGRLSHELADVEYIEYRRPAPASCLQL